MSEPETLSEAVGRLQRMHDALKGHGNGEMQRDRRALAMAIRAISLRPTAPSDSKDSSS